MNLFNFLNRKAILYDEFFGYLRPAISADNARTILKGKGFFIPTKSVTDYFIYCTKKGPSVAQRQFYSDLQTEFDFYANKMCPIILSFFREKGYPMTIDNFNAELMVVSITIPSDDESSEAWSMTLMERADNSRQFRIEFKGDDPFRISSRAITESPLPLKGTATIINFEKP